MYKKKCLFRNSNGTWGQDATAIESVFAYLYSNDSTKQTGRYRIRITKMSAAELISMGVAPENTPHEFFGLQASLDKWHLENGWIPLFDWVGDADASLAQIEKDLNKQFRSFMTGVGIEEDFSFDLPKPPTPEKNTFKKPKREKPDAKVKPVEPKESPDFDWI